MLIHGPRQCGKTTLARHIGDAEGYAYISFDDDVQREVAQTDPVGFIAGVTEPVILDEVQRVPELFTSLKAAVDADRTPGRFILTGSANVLFVSQLSDSLVGRMPILRRHPLAQVELEGGSPNGFLKRLIKTPKLHMGDTGLTCALLGVDADELWEDRSLFGQLLETFVFQELKRQASWHEDPVTFYHFRDKDKNEVDVVLESGRRLIGIEVKAGSTVRTGDFNGLRKLKAAARKKFVAGVLMYDGDAVVSFGDRLWALPISLLGIVPE